MYENITPESIKAEILQALPDWDTREGSFADDMCGPVALNLYKMYSALNAVQPMVWVDETSGKYLDMAAEDLGIEPRKAGTKAQAVFTITGTEGLSIPAGTLFLTADGIYFISLEDVDFSSSGTASVKAESQEVGTKCNVGPGTITSSLLSDSRLQGVTNPDSAEGGTDLESDTALYTRIVAARQRPSTSGNVHDYEKWALEVSGVGAARVFPLADGPGTVKVSITDEFKKPVSGPVAEACAAHINEMKPVGATVTVQTATEVKIVVEAAVSIDSEKITPEQVEARFKKALEEYFQSIAFVKNSVPLNRVGALLIGIDGVLDYEELVIYDQKNQTLVGLYISSGSLILGENEIPAYGGVNFRWLDY